MLDQWNHHVPVYPPSPPSAPSPASLHLFLNSQPTWVSDHPLNLLVSGTDDGLGFDLSSLKLTPLWYSSSKFIAFDFALL